MIWIGICLEICAAALGTISKQLIAYSEHVKKRWIFHIGASINILVGPVVDASAYAFAPQVVVAPFACLDVIFNVMTAPYTLHWQNEVITTAHIYGTLLVAVGAVFTSMFGSVNDQVLDVYELEAQLTRPASLMYLTTELVAIVAINLCLKMKLLSPICRGISLGVIAGVMMGNAFCMKGFIGLVRISISTGSTEAWLRPTPYILIACAALGAVVGHMFMRKGLGEYKGIFMVTIFEGAHIVAACLSGCIVMSEMAHAPWWKYVLYWCSVSLIVLGMLLINTAAADAKLGRSFHIAQSFAADAKKVSNSIGRPYRETFVQPIELAGSGKDAFVEEPLLENLRRQADGSYNDSDTELDKLKTYYPTIMRAKCKSVDDIEMQMDVGKAKRGLTKGHDGKKEVEIRCQDTPGPSPPKRRLEVGRKL
jgi:hypothetical protein